MSEVYETKDYSQVEPGVRRITTRVLLGSVLGRFDPGQSHPTYEEQPHPVTLEPYSVLDTIIYRTDVRGLITREQLARALGREGGGHLLLPDSARLRKK